jgi:hypothetical protein
MNDLPITTPGRRTPNLSRMRGCPTQQIVCQDGSLKGRRTTDWVEPTAPALVSPLVGASNIPPLSIASSRCVSDASVNSSGLSTSEEREQPPRMVVRASVEPTEAWARERSTCQCSVQRSIPVCPPHFSASGPAATSSPMSDPHPMAACEPHPRPTAPTSATPRAIATGGHPLASSASARRSAERRCGVWRGAKTKSTCPTSPCGPEPCSLSSDQWRSSPRSWPRRSRRAPHSPGRSPNPSRSGSLHRLPISVHASLSGVSTPPIFFPFLPAAASLPMRCAAPVSNRPQSAPPERMV